MASDVGCCSRNRTPVPTHLSGHNKWILRILEYIPTYKLLPILVMQWIMGRPVLICAGIVKPTGLCCTKHNFGGGLFATQGREILISLPPSSDLATPKGLLGSVPVNWRSFYKDLARWSAKCNDCLWIQTAHPQLTQIRSRVSKSLREALPSQNKKLITNQFKKRFITPDPYPNSLAKYFQLEHMKD